MKVINLLASIMCFWLSGATWGAGRSTTVTILWAVMGIANMLMIGVGSDNKGNDRRRRKNL